MVNNKLLIGKVSDYYTNKLLNYGATPQGVDWNGPTSQYMRFQQLCRIIDDKEKKFTINDLGCGYGGLLDYLSPIYPDFSYIGIDVSEEMIKSANLLHKDNASARFIAASEPDSISDFSVASGVFNVRLEIGDLEWLDYIEHNLDILNRMSLRGFAFNCLTSYSDDEKKRNYLYYADPCKLFDICKKKYSLQVALLHDYGLYEFTIVVRK